MLTLRSSPMLLALMALCTPPSMSSMIFPRAHDAKGEHAAGVDDLHGFIDGEAAYHSSVPLLFLPPDRFAEAGIKAYFLHFSSMSYRGN